MMSRQVSYILNFGLLDHLVDHTYLLDHTPLLDYECDHKK